MSHSNYKSSLILNNISEYTAWANLKQRCNNSRSPRYHRYGGRGIRVCDRWATFENFMTDMGPKPNEKFTIERIDNDGDYCPENCAWGHYLEQFKNKTYPQRKSEKDIMLNFGVRILPEMRYAIEEQSKLESVVPSEIIRRAIEMYLDAMI